MQLRYVIAILALLLVSSHARATPTQDEVFKSINSSVGQQQDPTTLLYFAAGAVVLVILIAIVNRLAQRAGKIKTVNHPGRLLKELASRAALRPAEVRQLKLLGESSNLEPLTLLLCPSAFAKAVQTGPTKLDRKVIANLVRRLQAESL